MSDVSSYAAKASLQGPATFLAATKAKEVSEQHAEQLLQAVAPAKADSAQISPQAQALLAATRPPV